MSREAEIIEAVKAGDTARVGALLADEPGLLAARAESGESAILLSVYYGHAAVTELFLSQAPELTLFEAAAAGDAARALSLLEDDPAGVHTYSHDGFTPLHLAAFFDHGDVVDLLVERGAIVSAPARNQTFASGVTPLHSAAARGNRGIAQALLDGGADVDARDGGGWRPLHTAAANGNIELVSLFLSVGADVHAENDDGRTPLSVALEHEREGAVALLQQHGAAR